MYNHVNYVNSALIPPGALNRVPALIGWVRGGNVTSAGWQVTLCDPVCHVSTHSGEALAFTYTCTLLCLTTYKITRP